MINHLLCYVWHHPHSNWGTQCIILDTLFLNLPSWLFFVRPSEVRWYWIPQIIFVNFWPVLKIQIATFVVNDDIQVLFKGYFCAYFSAVPCLNFSSILDNIKSLEIQLSSFSFCFIHIFVSHVNAIILEEASVSFFFTIMWW